MNRKKDPMLAGLCKNCDNNYRAITLASQLCGRPKEKTATCPECRRCKTRRGFKRCADCAVNKKNQCSICNCKLKKRMKK